MIELIEKLGELKKEMDIVFIHTDVIALVAYIKEQKVKETNIT